MKRLFFPGCTFATAAGYATSVAAVAEVLELPLIELPDWNCCGATAYFSLNELPALMLPARNLALAENLGAEEVITPCNACLATSAKARQKLLKHQSLFEKVNWALAEDRLQLFNPPRLIHLLDLFLEEKTRLLIKVALKRPLKDITVAAYYGCQYSRPPFWAGRDPENPNGLERLAALTGAKVIDLSSKTACCGATQAVIHSEIARRMVKKIVLEARYKGADLIVTLCPLCQFNLETLQLQGHLRRQLPVIFFSQLIGLALGLEFEALGLKRLLIPFEPAVGF